MVARVPSPDPQDVPSPTKSELMDECKSMVEAFRRRRQRVIDAEMREVSGNGSESDASTREPVKAELPTPRGEEEERSPGTLSRSTLPRWTPSHDGSPTSSSVDTEDIIEFDREACSMFG